MKAHYNNLLLRNLYGQNVFQNDEVDKAFSRSPYMQKFGSELSRTQASTKSLGVDALMKGIETKLMEKGVYRGDNMILRMLIQSGMFDQVSKYLKK